MASRHHGAKYAENLLLHSTREANCATSDGSTKDPFGLRCKNVMYKLYPSASTIIILVINQVRGESEDVGNN